MSACPKALGDGRYCWRNDLVLRTVADTVDAAIRANNFKPEAKPIYFVKADECPPPHSSTCKINSCLLSTARDWLLKVDIEERLKVQEQIATTTLRPDLILWSTETRQAVLIDLTISLEENIEVAGKRKLEKYQELVEQCKSNKWRTARCPIEVGYRGFAGRSLCRILNRLGRIGEKRERPSVRFQNQLKKRRNCYGLKDQILGKQQRLTSVELFDDKIESVWKRKEMKKGLNKEREKTKKTLTFSYVHMYI